MEAQTKKATTQKTPTPEVLEYDENVPKCPLGHTWGTKQYMFNPAFTQVYCEDNSRVNTPKELSGLYTGKAKAEAAIEKWLKLQWKKVK